MSKDKKIKVLIAKPGLDGHSRGARMLTLALREEGMDAVYSGLRRTPEEIIDRALKEKPDVLGLSILSGAHNTLLPRVVELAKAKGLDSLIIAGGLIPDEDVSFLQGKGISAVFGPGSSVKEIADYIRKNVN